MIFFQKWGGGINKNNFQNRKKISCFFRDPWYSVSMKKKMILVKNQSNEVVWSVVLPDFFTKADLKGYVARAKQFAKHFSNSSVFILCDNVEKNRTILKKIP